MNEPVTKDTFELEVADFGPIVEARIDLRPLTVFVGPSNTGKSYLAILIYALHRFFGGDPGLVPGPFHRGYPILHGLKTDWLPDATIAALLETARELQDPPEPPERQGVLLRAPVTDLIRSSFDESGNALGREICRCFGIDDAGTLTRRGRRKGARVELRRRTPSDSARFEHHLTLSGQTAESRTTIPEEIPVNPGAVDHVSELLRRTSVEEWQAEERDRIRWIMGPFTGILHHLALPYLISPLHLPAYYLPADRTGVMHAHSVVVSALIASAPTAGLRPAARTPMLSGVLADFLEQLIAVDRLRRPGRKRQHDLGTNIEQSMLGGSVRVDRSATTDYPRFTYRPDGWEDDLPLMNASSMVSELAPVVLYLRHMVGPGNVLIIEEPESHLHPAMQVEFTRQLAALVGTGSRVIVTTHSEWLLEELANIVRRSELSEVERGDGVALCPDQVGAWLFEPKRQPERSVVREICLDDSGLYPSGFDEVAAALHNEWAELSSRIGAGP